MVLNPYIQRLINNKMGFTLKSPAEFEQLSNNIFKTTGKILGVNTLKRLFGKLPDVNPSETTLNIIAEYLGYSNWDVLKKFSEDKNSILNGTLTAIYPKDLAVGQLIKVNYEPDREVRMTVREDKRCLVTLSKGCKVCVGDILDIFDIITGYPFTVHLVERDGKSLGSYIGGMEEGVKKIEIIDPKKESKPTK